MAAPMTDAELVAGLETMLGAASVCYPNPTETELHRRKKEGTDWLESDAALVVLNGRCGKDQTSFENQVLKKLKHGKTITTFCLWGTQDEDGAEEPPFDFTGFSELVRQYLPKLQKFNAHHMPLGNFKLVDVPTIEEVELTDPETDGECWSLRLPNLKRLVMSNHSPPATSFAESLIACPRIEEFFAHKYWTGVPSLYLPSCKRFTFRRADCLTSLSLYLPRVESLNLDACYDLKKITFLQSGHADHKDVNLPVGETQSKFKLSCINANLGPKVKRELLSSGRLLNQISEGQSDANTGAPGSGGGGMDNLLRGVMSGQKRQREEADGEDDMEIEDENEEEEEEEEDDDDDTGTAVIVRNLASRPELNGKRGVIVEVFLEKKRYGVMFDHDKNITLSIKMTNCEILDERWDNGVLQEVD